MPFVAVMLELFIWIWSPNTTILPFGALMPVWLSRVMLREVMLLILFTALLTKVVNTGGAVAGGARVEPLPRLLI